MIMIIQQDFPEDTTGRFNGLKDFIRSNFELCKWIGLVIVVAQVCFSYNSNEIEMHCCWYLI